MATKKETAEQKPVFSIKGMTVANVRKLGENVIAFSLLGNGLGLYNLRVLNGRNGEFVATPQEKGKDEKYHSLYAVYLSEEDEKRVIAAVKGKLPKEEEPKDIPF